MNPHPAPNLPGNTEAERMDAAVRKMFATPKSAFLKEEKKYLAMRESLKRAKKTKA